jgi:multimeric flavodoxin WrbA
MSKQILVIRGSARADGYTNRLCDEVASICKDCTVRYFNTYKEEFKPCTGCNYCESNGKCVYRDIDAFFEAFETSDVIVFASPVFNGCFSAPIKALIDRFQVYYTGYFAKGRVQQIEKQRDAILITAAGQSGEEATAYMSAQLSCAFTILNMRLKRSILCSYTDTEPCYEQALEELRRSLSDE